MPFVSVYSTPLQVFHGIFTVQLISRTIYAIFLLAVKGDCILKIIASLVLNGSNKQLEVGTPQLPVICYTATRFFVAAFYIWCRRLWRRCSVNVVKSFLKSRVNQVIWIFLVQPIVTNHFKLILKISRDENASYFFDIKMKTNSLGSVTDFTNE